MLCDGRSYGQHAAYDEQLFKTYLQPILHCSHVQLLRSRLREI